MKIKFFKKEKNFKKEDFKLNPNIFWKSSVFMVFLVIIFSAFFGYFLFLQISKETALGVNSPGSQIETIKKERIDKVLEYFSARKQKSNKILNSPSPIIDPSL